MSGRGKGGVDEVKAVGGWEMCMLAGCVCEGRQGEWWVVSCVPDAPVHAARDDTPGGAGLVIVHHGQGRHTASARRSRMLETKMCYG